MKFAVLGAGAIGAYAGAALARGGAEVTLIARGAHLAAMASRGVRVLSPRGDFTAHPRATGDLAAVSAADVVFVALKAYSLPEIAPRLGQLLAPGAATIWAQNGIPWWYFQSLPEPVGGAVLESVDPGGVISGSIGPEHNVGCVAYCSTEIIEPGVIRHIEGTRFTLGEPGGSTSERCKLISAAFAAGGLKAPVEARLGRRWGSLARWPRCATCCGQSSPNARRWPGGSGSASRSRLTGGSRPAWRWARTRHRCCRTSRPGSGLSWTA